MTEREQPRNRGPPATASVAPGLEDILNVTPTYDTDVMDFVLISGLVALPVRYYWGQSQLYRSASKELQEQIAKRYRERRASLSQSDRTKEGRTASILWHAHIHGHDTLHKFKTFFEATEYDDVRRVFVSGVPGRGTFTYLNQVLERYGLDPVVPFAQLQRRTEKSPYS